MTGWHDGPMLAFDTETSGIDPTQEFIVTAALVRLVPGEEPRKQLWLLQPPAGREIPEGAKAIHGITTEHAREHGAPRAQSLKQIRGVIVGWLRSYRPLVAFNASYDCTVLEHELAREGLATVTAQAGQFFPVIDPHVIDKHVSYRKGSRKLESTCEFYSVRIDGAHDATHDAIAAARVAWRLGASNGRIGALSLAELHAEQVAWRLEQMDSLRLYFEQRGQQHDGCDPSWPVRSTPALTKAVA